MTTKALARLREVADYKLLDHGVYISREKPVFLSEEELYDEDEDDEGNGGRTKADTYKAVVTAYNVNSESFSYAWKTEIPKQVVNLSMNGMDKFMKEIPKIFANAQGAKYKAGLSDGETAFCFQGPGGWLVIAIDND